MPNIQHLIERLDMIGRSLAQREHGLALLGLGSVGTERERLDEYSDLDFFAVVKTGYKQHYLEDLGWLSCICPVVYTFANTADGYKLLFADGIFAEFAVFEPQELAQIEFSAGYVVWRAEDFDVSMLAPPPKRESQRREISWLVGEALTNLYVGLSRYRRGEKLSAQRFIQHYAVDRLLELASMLEIEQPGYQDKFSPERRFEQRFPKLSQQLPEFVQGYDRTPQSAQAILGFLEQHFEVNAAMKAEIERLL